MSNDKKILPIVQDYIKIRYDANISQEMLSNLSGVLQTVIATIEIGEVTPILNTLDRLVNTLGYKIVMIYNGDVSDDIITTITKIRQSKNMNRAKLSSVCGVANSTLACIERGDGSPKLSTLYKIANALEARLEIIPWETKKTEEAIIENLCIKLQNLGITADENTTVNSIVQNLYELGKAITIIPTPPRQNN